MDGFALLDPQNMEYRKGDRLVTFSIDADLIHFEDGPSFEAARRHEAMGGSQSISQFKTEPYPWIYDYPGLHEEVCLYLNMLGL